VSFRKDDHGVGVGVGVGVSSSGGFCMLIHPLLGTGFYVEKTVKEAGVFYEGKVKELQVSLSELEKIVQGKSENLRAVEDGESRLHCILFFGAVDLDFVVLTLRAVMRQKILDGNSQASAGAGSAAT
jgi:hypothetical protein